MAGRDIDVTLFDSVEAAESVWREFEVRTPCTPFERYDWLHTWSEHAGSDITPCPVLLQWGDDSRLLLPLAITRRAGVRVLSWLGDRVSDYNVALGPPDSPEARILDTEIREGWATVLRALPPVDVVHLRGQPASRAGRPNPLTPLLGRRTGVALESDLRGGWPQFRDTHLSKSRRKQSRRHRRRLAERGEVGFERVRDVAELEQLVWAAARMKRTRYPGSTRLADDRVRFYADAARRMAGDDGSLGFSLRCGGDLIAVEWGLQHQGRYVGFLEGFDPRWSEYSPGHFLMEEVAAWCSSAGLHTYDLSTGNEDFKRAWTDRRTTMHEYLEALTLRGRAYVLAQRAAGHSEPLRARLRGALHRGRWMP